MEWSSSRNVTVVVVDPVDWYLIIVFCRGSSNGNDMVSRVLILDLVVAGYLAPYRLTNIKTLPHCTKTAPSIPGYSSVPLADDDVTLLFNQQICVAPRAHAIPVHAKAGKSTGFISS